MKHLSLLIFLILISRLAVGQVNQYYRWKEVNIASDSIKLDSLIILPASFKIYHKGQLLPKEWYRLDAQRALLFPKKQLKAIGPMVNISYRVFPYPIHRPYSKRDYSIITSPHIRERYTAVSGTKQNQDLFGSSLINKRGSLSRGISFGNNQDVVVNSNLNLQLSGQLNDKVSILAALSDNNIPLQPNGNTQQIKDFDRIFIKLYDANKEVTLGDYQLESPTGKFMRFYRKVQGGKFTGEFGVGEEKQKKWKTTLSGSISKGKFNRMEIPGIEGNQGPYRLRGKNNETYIIVLAGSEKIYIDGKLQQRGEQNDYTINYNTAELTFTPNRPINRNSRIVAEFEYSEENYARFLLFNSHEFKSKNANFYINFYSEQDSKNQPLDQNLSEEQKLLLSQVGDQLELARIPRIDSVEFSNDRVLYKKEQRLVNGQPVEIYIHSTNSDSAHLQVSFTFVGEGNGNYIPIKSSSNGRVYEWKAPQDGILQGSYEPIAQLISPEKHQMLSMGGEIQLNENTSSDFELALSNKDLNTFSSQDDGNNKGLALDLNLKKFIPIKDSTLTNITSTSYRYIHKNFAELEPFQEIEYERDWNIEPQSQRSSEHLLKIGTQFQHQKWGNLGYDAAYRKREANYQGIRHNAQFNLKRKGFQLSFQGNLLNTEQQLLTTNFLRHTLHISQALPILKLGIETESEENKWKPIDSEELQSNSFAFESIQFYLTLPEKFKNKLSAHYRIRKDKLPQETQLKDHTKAEDFGLSYQLLKNPKNQLKTSINYRQLSILSHTIDDQKPENTLLGRLEHQARVWKGLIQTNTFYQIGSGLEAEKEFSYIEVSAGQGIYRWQDYNENNIKELDEFEVANFADEAQYIRIFTPSNNYQKVYTNEFRQNINLRFSRLRKNKGLLNFLSRFNNRFAYRINQKSSNKDFEKYANPFNAKPNSTDILSLSSSIQNTLSYKKKGAKTHWDLIHLSNRSKQLLANGSETNRLQQNGIRFRWKFKGPHQLSNRIDRGTKKFSSEFFSNKNYNIHFIKEELKLKLQPSLKYQLGFNYMYQNKKNHQGKEEAEIHSLSNEMQYSISKNGNLAFSASYLNVQYKEATNTSLAYEMMEGFLPGNNLTWNLALNNKISKTFHLRVSYNARYSEGGRTIHTGNMELRAQF